jgi:hypothetical protein
MKTLLTAIIIVLALLAIASDELPPQPSYGTAVVDGDISEWDMAEDYFAPMHEAGKLDKEILSNLYLRYNSRSHVLYALVLAEGSHIVANMPDDAFIKLGNTDKLVDGTYGNDGNPPDFEWVDDGVDLVGWEASVYLNTGVYQELNIKTQIVDDRTAAVAERGVPIYLNGEPTAITTSGFRAGKEPNWGFVGAIGGVLVASGIMALAWMASAWRRK